MSPALEGACSMQQGVGQLPGGGDLLPHDTQGDAPTRTVTTASTTSSRPWPACWDLQGACGHPAGVGGSLQSLLWAFSIWVPHPRLCGDFLVGLSTGWDAGMGTSRQETVSGRAAHGVTSHRHVTQWKSRAQQQDHTAATRHSRVATRAPGPLC